MNESAIMIFAIVVATMLIFLCVWVTVSEEKKKIVKNDNSSYLIPLMGTNFRNPNSAYIQDAIEMMLVGDNVNLQVGSYDGKKSVRVDSYYGTIGFLPRHFAYIISDLMESGTLGEAQIARIQPSRIGHSKTVAIRVYVDEKIKPDSLIF